MNLATLQQEFCTSLIAELPFHSATSRAVGHGHRAAGLAVYRNNYRTALANCLADNFATTRAWLGDEAFDRAVTEHILVQPPHSWTLDDYTIEFPSTLDTLYPKDPEVGELAFLERDLGLAFVGADTAALELCDLQGMDWERAVLNPVPTFKLLSLRSNAAAIWTALQAKLTPPPSARLDVPLTVALWRQGFIAKFRALDCRETLALTLIQENRTFADVCATLAEQLGEVEGVRLAGQFLGQWVSEGIFGRKPR